MKKVYIIILMAIILFSMISFAFAEGAAPQKGDEITRIREEVELREPNADTYLLSDGSYECVVYSDNKYFENDSGELVEIDNSIVNAEMTIGEKSYSYANKANSSIIHFSNTKPAVYIESKGKSLSFEMVDAQNTEAIPGGNKKMEAISDYELSGDNYITYMDVKPQTDLVYEIKNGLLKEYIVLKSPEAPSEYSFEFNTNYNFEKSKDGNIIIIDENGEVLFELGNLFAVDSAEAYTDALEYSITENDDCKNVTVSISPEYLNAPERAFPVLIDPSTMITGENNTYDSYVSSNHASTNYYTSTYLKTGRSTDYHIRRSYIKFSIPTSILNSYISSATLKIKKRGGVAPTTVKARRITSSWSSSEVTWSNKPDTATTGFSFSLDSDNWYSAIVTNIVKKWAEEGKTNRGFELKDDTESGTDYWTNFYSSDADSPNKPELHITYYSNNQYLSYGYGSSTVYVHPYSFDNPWQNAINQSRNNWNDSNANVHIGSLASSNNYIFVGVYDGTQYGKYIPKDQNGSEVTRFHIQLNKNQITSAANNLSNFIQSVTVHEFGHAFWLKDNPNTPRSSIMKYSRDRDTMINPSNYDVQNVKAKY